eukprot:1645032-Pleurochrysis_carterae.AAC.1
MEEGASAIACEAYAECATSEHGATPLAIDRGQDSSFFDGCTKERGRLNESSAHNNAAPKAPHSFSVPRPPFVSQGAQLSFAAPRLRSGAFAGAAAARTTAASPSASVCSSVMSEESCAISLSGSHSTSSSATCSVGIKKACRTLRSTPVSATEGSDMSISASSSWIGGTRLLLSDGAEATCADEGYG